MWSVRSLKYTSNWEKGHKKQKFGVDGKKICVDEDSHKFNSSESGWHTQQRLSVMHLLLAKRIRGKCSRQRRN